MKELPTQSRAYVCKVPNRKARTSASSEYFQVFVEDGCSYLFTANELTSAAKRADKNPEDIIRKKEDIYKKLSLKNSDTTKLIQAISKNPILLERPIVSNGKKAIIGRPPENVFSLL